VTLGETALLLEDHRVMHKHRTMTNAAITLVIGLLRELE
jgi:hypothetical protein